MSTRKPIHPIHEKGIQCSFPTTTKLEKFLDDVGIYAILVCILPVSYVCRVYKYLSKE